MNNTQLRQQGDLWIGQFTAMSCPCEILVETPNPSLAEQLLHIAASEALRIQHKFSRYENNNPVWQLNNAEGKPVSIDDETQLLVHFADQCYQLSDGLFDITSGSLGRVWKFDGSANIPSQAAIESALALVGWQKVERLEGQLRMPAGMQLDFGGIGKEYAVDRCLLLIQQHLNHCKLQVPVLINFGGDLAVNGSRAQGEPWQVGIETPGAEKKAHHLLDISAGALATSGDAQRFLLANNQRYSHILNPFTGWPVNHAPRSITVAASNCIQAGMLATFGLLQGANAETFLAEQGTPFWVLR